MKQENKMGIMPVNKLLITMSLPMMISMLVQALYNIVDSIFVSMISENALSAVSLAFPIQTLLIAVATGTGVGVNAILSRALGEKNPEKASSAAMHGVILAIISFIVFVFIGIFAVKPFYRTQTMGADIEIFNYGVQYASIVCIASFGIFGQIIFERLLQSTGKTIYSMYVQATGAMINIILDPILIFGLFGMPKLGVSGAALATVTGQIVAAIMAIFFNFKVNKEIKLSLKCFKFDKKMIGTIYSVGAPSIIMQAIGSVMNYGMNLILIGFTSTATAVFGIYYKIQSIFFMPVFGLNNGMVPVVAYNYGAGNRKRLVKTIKLSVMYAMILTLMGFLAFQILPHKLLGLFEASSNMLEIGIPALRIISISYLAAGFCIVAGSVFQALGNGIYSLIVSVARQLIILLPTAFILSKLGGLMAVWWAFPIAEIMSFAVSSLFMSKINKDIISKIPDGNI